MMADDFHLPQNCTGQKTRQQGIDQKNEGIKLKGLGISAKKRL